MRPRAVALAALLLLAAAALPTPRASLRRAASFRYRLITGCERLDRALDVLLIRRRHG